jgi:hypothetical protein
MSQHVCVNGQTTHLQPAHRPATGHPAVLVSSTVELTTEEVAAILHDWIAYGGEIGELDDDERVHLLVAETVVNGGCVRVDELYAAARDGELLRECDRRAREVFSPGVCSLTH